MAGEYEVAALVVEEQIFQEELAIVEQQLVAAVVQLGNMESMAVERIVAQQHRLVAERMGSVEELVELVSLELVVERKLVAVVEQLVFEQPFFELVLVEYISWRRLICFT